MTRSAAIAPHAGGADTNTAPPGKAPPMTIAHVRHFIFDMDGTLYLGDQLFQGSPALLERLKATGRKWCYITNNSSKSTRDYLAKIRRLGIPVDAPYMITSGAATADYLLREAKLQRIYLLGTPSLAQELAEAGLELVEERAQAVVLGFDLTFTWDKFNRACRLLREGAAFIATHPDLTCPSPEGPLPDCGALTAAFTAATGFSPVVIGKPHRAMLDTALHRMGAAPANTAIVGDRLYTDMEMGFRGGLTTILVLTGESTAATAKAAPRQPDLILPSITELAALL
jgi:phosphoglycolate/pyridoxal phosphate phosphatase family enzyme